MNIRNSYHIRNSGSLINSNRVAVSNLWKRAVALVLILILLVPMDAHAAKKRRKKSTVYPTAVAAYLWDATANKALYAKNIDRRVYPASTTKVMTAILVLERLNLDQYVTVKSSALQVQDTKLYLRPGEQYRVRDLLHAILLKSANDAANVLGEAVAGSQTKFIDLMNKRAAALGARNTKFANAHGLPSQGQQYTTARDMALIFRAALKNPFFRKAITFKYRIIYSKEGRRFFLKSHNTSLFREWKRDIYGKTGYTNDAGACFVGYFMKGKNIIIVDVFRCRKRWDDIKYIVENYGKVDL